MRNRYVCKSCGGLCDAGELQGGECLECRQAAEEMAASKERTRKMLRRSLQEQEDGQLVIGGII